MKKNKNIFIGIGICVITACFFYAIYSKNTYHSTVTTGQIISKDCNVNSKYPYTITLKVLDDESTTDAESIKIAVKEVMIWNLIEKNRFYFVNYQWKNNELPVLYQIENNDKFGDIFKKKFSK